MSFQILYNKYNECFYVKDKFKQILNVFNTREEAEVWLKLFKEKAYLVFDKNNSKTS